MTPAREARRIQNLERGALYLTRAWLEGDPSPEKNMLHRIATAAHAEAMHRSRRSGRGKNEAMRKRVAAIVNRKRR